METIIINDQGWTQIGSAGQNISAKCMSGGGAWVYLDDVQPSAGVPMTEGIYYKYNEMIGMWNLSHNAYARTEYPEARIVKQID